MLLAVWLDFELESLLVNLMGIQMEDRLAVQLVVLLGLW